MIASLPMYDWPETQAANDMLWQRFANCIAESGIQAPLDLTRSIDLEAMWLSPDLLLAQTCSYPLETVLKNRVRYVATPSYAVKGCEMPGHYRSVILMRGQKTNIPVPEGNKATLPDWSRYSRFGFNSIDSMSGYHALLRDAENAGHILPSQHIQTGSHRASIIAVANGTADICVVDCVTWNIALKYEPAAAELFVAGWTAERPGLPLITTLAQSEVTLLALRNAAKIVFNAVVLNPPTER